MNDILGKIDRSKVKKKALANLIKFLEAYGEIENPEVFTNDELVLAFNQGKYYFEVEFSKKDCQIICSTEDIVKYTPEQLARYLNPKSVEDLPRFEIGGIMDSMDLWEQQISLAEKMEEIIRQHKLWKHVPELRDLSKEWQKIQKKFDEESSQIAND